MVSNTNIEQKQTRLNTSKRPLLNIEHITMYHYEEDTLYRGY